MPVLNELLQEAAARTMALTEQADGALAAVGELLERARDLGETIEQQAQQAHGEAADLEAKLDAAPGQLGASLAHAEAALQGLDAAASRVAHRAGEVTGDVTEATSELDSRRQELVQAFDTDAESVSTAFATTAEHWHEAAAQSTDRVTGESPAIATLREAVDALRVETAERGRDLVALFDSVGEKLHEDGQQASAALLDSVQSQADALIDLEHRLKDAHNGAVVPLREAFTEHAAERLAAMLGPLREAVESLAAVCSEYDASLERDAAEVLSTCDGITVALARARDQLRAVDRLG